MINHKHILLICCLFTLLACQKDLNVLFTETNITTKNNTLVEINIPKAEGNSTEANEINSEITRVITNRLHIGDPNINTSKSIEESVTLFNNEYKAFKKDFPGAPQIWEAEIDGEVIFQTEHVISISVTSYTNTGGAHGILQVNLLNFDALTGKRIPNTNLFKKPEAFKRIAKTYFDNVIEDKSILFEPDRFQLPANIGYSEDGLILVYNVYEIAPYASGIIDFTIPYITVNPTLVLKGPK